MKDYGYDVADYCDVDPLFGTLEDFDRLLDDAHEKHIKVLIDWVPNHIERPAPVVRRVPQQPGEPEGRLVLVGRR